MLEEEEKIFYEELFINDSLMLFQWTMKRETTSQ
jgi:hypothetical protein